MIPFTLIEIAQDLADHPEGHGTNCVCMDEYIRRVRLAINCYSDEEVRKRLRYILQTASEAR